MKLLIVIVNKDDGSVVQSSLTSEGYSVTRLATSGGFLKSGNTTFLIGVENDRVSACIDLIGQCSRKRTQMMPNYSGYSDEYDAINTFVEQFAKENPAMEMSFENMNAALTKQYKRSHSGAQTGKAGSRLYILRGVCALFTG